MQWTAAVVVDHVSPADDRAARLAVLRQGLLLLGLALAQDPQDEILAAAGDGFVQRHVSSGAPQPEIRLMLGQQPQRFRLPLGGTAIRRTDFPIRIDQKQKKTKVKND